MISFVEMVSSLPAKNPDLKFSLKFFILFLHPKTLSQNIRIFYFNKTPRHAVCDLVLNLLTQVGSGSAASPWLTPIALHPETQNPFIKVLAQNALCRITNTAGYLSYTIIENSCIGEALRCGCLTSESRKNILTLYDTVSSDILGHRITRFNEKKYH